MERDIAEKQLEEHGDVFADIVNALVFRGKTVCRAENLAPIPTESYHRSESGKLRQRNRDILKKDERNGTVFLIVGLENQDGYDNTMVIRTMGYDFGSYDRQIKDIMKENEAISNQAYTKGILIELAGLSGEVRERFTSDFRLIADFVASQADLRRHRELMMDTERKIAHPQEVLDVLGLLGKDRRYKEIKKNILKKLLVHSRDFSRELTSKICFCTG